MCAAPVTVKWGKESYEVDVDPSLPGVVFKTQLFTLTGVPPERQKVMGCKSAPLKARRAAACAVAQRADAPAARQDDADMAAVGLKEVRCAAA